MIIDIKFKICERRDTKLFGYQSLNSANVENERREKHLSGVYVMLNVVPFNNGQTGGMVHTLLIYKDSFGVFWCCVR